MESPVFLPDPDSPASPSAPPLVVDLDGTLIRGDLAMEAMIVVARRGLGSLLALLAMLLRGRGALKTWLARVAPVDPARLAYRPQVLARITQARAQGRPVWLATAAHRRNALRVAAHVGLFDAVLASDHRHNLKGPRKLAAIGAQAGGQPFDYLGDSPADRPIWQAARCALTVGVASHCAHEQRLGPAPRRLRALARAARPHQWAKNALVFVPLASSGLLTQPAELARSLLAFACLSLIASGVYLINDLLDIEADRLHPRKASRPLAAGELSVPQALIAALGSTVLGLGMALALLPPAAFVAMVAYCALTLAYSLRLKAAMIADVLTLACLYTLRIIAGALALEVPVSSWLLLFSVFFFLSLGYLKRYVELLGSPRATHELLSGRGYVPADADIVAPSGIAAGMVAILVLVLFAEAMGRTGTYASPEWLWLLPLPLLYWLNRIWMMARRGQVDSDPVAFAITDTRSLAVGAIMAGLLLVAKFAHVPVHLLALVKP